MKKRSGLNYREWTNIIAGYFSRLTPKTAACEFGTPFVIVAFLSVLFCVTHQQSSVIRGMADCLPSVTVLFAVSFAVIPVIGKIRKNIKDMPEKQALCRELESVILRSACECYAEIVLMAVIFLGRTAAFSVSVMTVFIAIELFLAAYIFTSLIRSVTAVTLVCLQK